MNSSMQPSSIEPTEAHALKLLSILERGLCAGHGKHGKDGQVCIMEAISIAFDYPILTDKPYACTGQAVRMFDIILNDANWSTPEARAKGMKREGIAKLGSNQIGQQKFTEYITKEIIKRIIPLAFQNFKQTEELENLLKECKNIDSLDKGYQVSKKLAHYAADAVAYASYAATAAIAATTYAAAAAAYAAADATYAATAAAFAAAAGFDKRDSILSLASEIAVEALQEQNCPGCKFLYLCPL